MDKKIHTFADRQTENKRKQDNNQQQQQPQNNRQNTGRAYAAGTGKKKLYRGSKPLCPKSPANTNTANNQRDLMPVELGSFDAIIGMDWLVKYQAIIVCAEKIVRIPWGNETLIVYGDGSNRGNEARLHIISYTKIQEYMLKGCPVFLANVTTKETKDKSEKNKGDRRQVGEEAT
ncbi:putative reverse transcriptase domain-containing protein [Tanacetum coccineum]